MLMLTFLLSAAETLELTALALTLQKLVSFLPNLIAVVFIVVFGALLARFLGKLTRGAAADAGIDFAEFLGKLVTNVVILATMVIALSQMDIQSSVLDITFAAILGAFGLAIALTLGIGTKTISENIISGVYARRLFHVGQTLTLNGTEGRVVEIGTVSTIIESGDRRIIIPNLRLVQEISEARMPAQNP